jgi:hypothetical protein
MRAFFCSDNMGSSDGISASFTYTLWRIAHELALYEWALSINHITGRVRA